MGRQKEELNALIRGKFCLMHNQLIPLSSLIHNNMNEAATESV